MSILFVTQTGLSTLAQKAEVLADKLSSKALPLIYLKINNP
ncbi:excinuclease ABC subunit A [Listeria monocytogenes]|nr:excinuclease ABC subunit A [Listeria monocytogenes]